MIKNLLFKYYFILIIVFPTYSFSTPNEALEDISPTHLQLFQLYSITEENKILLTSLLNPDAITKQEKKQNIDFIHELATGKYSAFIATQHTGADMCENYRKSAAFLLSKLPTFKMFNFHIFPINAPFEIAAAQVIIQNAIAEEVKAAAEGKAIYWRYDYGKQNIKRQPKSYSAPGILAGFLYDGLQDFLNPYNTCACTFIFTANDLYHRYYNSKTGLNELYEIVRRTTNSPDDTQLASLNMSVISNLYNENKKTSYNEKGETLTQIGTLDPHQSRMLQSKIESKNLYYENGEVYGVKIVGTYAQNQLKTLCPKTLLPIYALYGKGEDFHPRFDETATNRTYERVDLVKLSSS